MTIQYKALPNGVLLSDGKQTIKVTIFDGMKQIGNYNVMPRKEGVELYDKRTGLKSKYIEYTQQQEDISRPGNVISKPKQYQMPVYKKNNVIIENSDFRKTYGPVGNLENSMYQKNYTTYTTQSNQLPFGFYNNVQQHPFPSTFVGLDQFDEGQIKFNNNVTQFDSILDKMNKNLYHQ